MQKKVVFSLDTSDKKTVLRYVKKIADVEKIPDEKKPYEIKQAYDEIFALKIGTLNLLDGGIEIINKIKKITKLDIICDLKLAEIPHIAIKIAEKVYDSGAKYLVVQSFVGKQVIERILEAVPDLKIILVSEMTHNEGGFTERHLEDFALLAKNLRVFGIIGPGNRTERLRKIKNIVGDDVKIIAAGVSKQQEGREEDAINEGANYIIKGRPIMELLDKYIKSSDFLKKNLFIPIMVYIVLLGLSVFSKMMNWISMPALVSITGSAAVAITGQFIYYLRVKVNDSF